MTQPTRRDKTGEILPLADRRLPPLPLPSQSPFDGEQIIVQYGKAYYSYLIRFLERLCFPDAWQGTEEEKAIATKWAQQLIDLLGTPVMAVALQLRFTDTCLLQYSYDNENWADVDGWGEFAYICFQGPEGPEGPPPPVGPPGNTGEGPGEGTDIPIIDQTDCDLDTLFGFCLQLVDFQNTLIVDFFEVLETATNVLERIEIVLDEVPLFGPLVDLIEKLFNEMREAYSAAYSAELRQEYACGLFCVARAHDCTLTWQDVTDYFAQLIAADPLDDLVQISTFLLTGAWIGDIASHVMFFTFSWIVFKGSTWLGLSLETVRAYLATFWNDPNSDWLALCDECPPAWRADYDFLTSQCGMTLQGGTTYSAGVGLIAGAWPAEGENPATRRVLGSLTVSTLFQMMNTQITVATHTAGTWSGATSLWALAIPGQWATPHATRAELVAGGAKVYERLLDVEIAANGSIGVDGRCARFATNGALVISHLTIYGTGVPPQEVIDNATEFHYF